MVLHRWGRCKQQATNSVFGCDNISNEHDCNGIFPRSVGHATFLPPICGGPRPHQPVGRPPVAGVREGPCAVQALRPSYTSLSYRVFVTEVV